MHQWKEQLEQAALELLSWLKVNCGQFRDHMDSRGDMAEILRHLDEAETEPGHENDLYTFFLVEDGGVTIGGGFFETNGRYILLHAIGLCDHLQRRGIGRKLMSWYLGSLPNTANSAQVLAGVQTANHGVRNWCAQVRASEHPTNDPTVLVVQVAAQDIYEELSLLPLLVQPAFAQQWQGLTFRRLYHGRHPKHLAPGEEPICE